MADFIGQLADRSALQFMMTDDEIVAVQKFPAIRAVKFSENKTDKQRVNLVGHFRDIFVAVKSAGFDVANMPNLESLIQGMTDLE